MAILEFERPILEMEKKLEALRVRAELGEASPGEVRRLERRLQKLRQKIMGSLTRWQRVQLARHVDRPHCLDYIKGMLEEFVELRGDRLGHDDPAIVGGLGRLRGIPLVVIGHEKGRTPQERIERRFGMPHPEGNRKALRLMNLAERFSRPILTLVDTPGAYPGIEAEARGQACAIAENLLRWSTLKVPSVAVIIGEGGSGGALALAMADRVLMMEYSIYSVISPEGCAAILWKDEGKKKEAAEALKLTAQDALALGVIHDVIQEPPGGAHRDPDSAIEAVAMAVERNLRELLLMGEEERVRKRRETYRRMGVVVLGKGE